MKKYIFITYILTFFTNYNFAQNEVSLPCVNNVSTDYREDINGNPKAKNDKLPLVGVSPDNRFLNGFNWVSRSVNQTVAKYQTINMNSNILDAGEIQNIYSNQQHPFYSYLYNDIEPKQ